MKVKQLNKSKTSFWQITASMSLCQKNLTNHFQPLDHNVNGQAKQFLKRKFQSWYADQVTVNIETNLSVVKPLHARWLISFKNHIQNSREMIMKAFQMAGITPIVQIEIPDEDSFKNIQLVYTVTFTTTLQIFKIAEILKVIQ